MKTSGITFKTLSINTHCFEDDWQRRLDYICQFITQNDIDVISFQEVCEYDQGNATDYILQKLNDYGYPVNSFCKRFSHMAWNKYREHVLILSKHHAEDIRDADLPHSPFQRVYVALKIKGCWFVNTHLEFQEEWKDYRRNQIEFLASEWKNEQALIMGDFNSNMVDEEQGAFSRDHFAPVFPGKTFPSEAPQTAIDGFWLLNTLRHNNPNILGKLLFTDKINEHHYASDHLGVFVEIRFRAPSSK